MRIAAAFLILATPALADTLELPSGTQAVLYEVLIDAVSGEDWLRFRLVAPTIDAELENAPDYSTLEQDFPHLCETLVLPYMAEHTLSATKIAISLSDRIVDFGTSDPDATQYFELFSLKDGFCMWEAF